MPEPTVPFTQRALDFVRRELVVIAPIILAVVAVLPAGTSITDYKVWAPIAIGVFLRQFVTTPAKEAEEAVKREGEEAFEQGVVLGKNLPRRGDF